MVKCRAYTKLTQCNEWMQDMLIDIRSVGLGCHRNYRPRNHDRSLINTRYSGNRN